VLGGDEVYVCAVEAAAVVKVVMWRTRQSPKVLELEAAPPLMLGSCGHWR
jgi:hypothetical protein